MYKAAKKNDSKKKYKTVILDVDGVILESTNIKTEVFREMFSHEKDNVDKIVQFHIENTGISRFDKFRYIYTTILKQPLSDEKFESLCNKFSEMVFDKVINAPFVKGAEGFIQQYSTRLPLFVVSATPHEEVRLIMERKGLKRYFKDIYGSPKKKSEWIKYILKSNEWHSKDALFVGDTKEDYESAIRTGVGFILRNKNDNSFVHTEPTLIAILPDLVRLPEFVVI